jgi:hypothetical protein
VKFVFEKTGLQKISPECQHKNLSFFGVRASSRLPSFGGGGGCTRYSLFSGFRGESIYEKSCQRVNINNLKVYSRESAPATHGFSCPEPGSQLEACKG